MNNGHGNMAFAALFIRGLELHSLEPGRFASAWQVNIAAEQWGRAGQLAAAAGMRWVSLWADQAGEELVIRAALEYGGDHLLLATVVPVAQASVDSQAQYCPGADRLERHAHDMFGIEFKGHPDPRRWTRHRAWSAERFPLRSEFPAAGIDVKRTPADADYPFAQIRGSGVYEIPVGPVHAGIIEPGHFRFKAVGEEVLLLEERLGYVHKGIEKIAVGREAKSLARLAGRVSGDTCVAHAWAACQAMERAAQCEPPPRAVFLRALMAERERIANHLGDIGAICNDVGFTFAHMQCARLREIWQRRNHELFGHRMMMDVLIPGGVSSDLDSVAMAALRSDHQVLRREAANLFDIIDDHPSLQDRLAGSGVLSAQDARALGCTGYVGKASGQAFDARCHSAYAPYDRFNLPVVVYGEGDVAARVRVRMDEVQASLELMEQLLAELPPGDIAAAFAPVSQADGIGIIEGWRGEIVTYVRFDGEGRIARFFPRDPSWFTWPALERLIHGNIVPDFPVCNKSVNGSYSGHDL